MSVGIEKVGYMVMKGVLAWGVTYEDGHSTSYGWVCPTKATMVDHKLKSPTDLTYPNSYLISELKTGTVVKVKKTITIEVVP